MVLEVEGLPKFSPYIGRDFSGFGLITRNIAHTEEEACNGIEAGFDFVCDYDGNKIFKKRK
jgi:hypothetical protein